LVGINSRNASCNFFGGEQTADKRRQKNEFEWPRREKKEGQRARPQLHESRVAGARKGWGGGGLVQGENQREKGRAHRGGPSGQKHRLGADIRQRFHSEGKRTLQPEISTPRKKKREIVVHGKKKK